MIATKDWIIVLHNIIEVEIIVRKFLCLYLGIIYVDFNVFFLSNCLCGSCRNPFDRARRIPVTNNKTKHTVVICPRCICVKCKVPIVNIPFVNCPKGK